MDREQRFHADNYSMEKPDLLERVCRWLNAGLA
jgi:hypothetical protein